MRAMATPATSNQILKRRARRAAWFRFKHHASAVLHGPGGYMLAVGAFAALLSLIGGSK